MSPELVVGIILAFISLFSSTGAVVALYRLRSQKAVDAATAAEITERVDTMHAVRESKKWEDLWKEWAADRRIAGERFERLVDLEEYVTADINYHREVTVYQNKVASILGVCIEKIPGNDLTIPTPPIPPMLPRHHPRPSDVAE